MAIEPLGSMMSLQSQKANTSNVQKTAGNDTEVRTPEQTGNLDAVTLSVKQAEKKEAQDEQADSREQQAENEKIRKTVERLNKKMSHSEAVFGIHDDTNRVMIKIIDRDTKKVLKEYPPEQTLDMIAKVWELAGILVDEKK